MPARVTRTHAASRMRRAAEAVAKAQRKADRVQHRVQLAEWTATRKANAAKAKADREAAGPHVVAAYARRIERNRIKAAANREAEKAAKEAKTNTHRQWLVDRQKWLNGPPPTDEEERAVWQRERNRMAISTQ